MRKHRNRYSVQIYDTMKSSPLVSGKRCMSLSSCIRWAKNEESKRCKKDDCYHLRFAIYDQRGDEHKLMVEVASYELHSLGVRKQGDEEELYNLYGG